MAMSRVVICSVLSASLVLSACAVRPATTYHRYTPSGQPQTGQAAVTPPAAAAAQAKTDTAAAAKPATFQVPPGGAASQPAPEKGEAPTEPQIVNGSDMANNYVIPAVMIVGTVVAAGLFWWGNTHWFE